MSTKHRKAARVDSNQNAIMNFLRDLPGVTVEPGHDDILVGYKGVTYWFEIKKSEKAEIKKSQKRLLAEYTGHYMIAWNVGQILKEINYPISEM